MAARSHPIRLPGRRSTIMPPTTEKAAIGNTKAIRLQDDPSSLTRPAPASAAAMPAPRAPRT
jgi:hypothetical protein